MVYSLYASSEVTLINPESPTELIFTKWSTFNTELLRDGRPYLKVSTTDIALPRTTVTDARTGEVLAVLRSKTLQANTVHFPHKYDGRTIKIKEWLLEGRLLDGSRKWTIKTQVGTFVWRLDIVHRLVLCPEGDLDNLLVYTTFPTRRDESTPWALILSHGTEEFHDEILVSYLVIETSLRDQERKSGLATGGRVSGAISSGKFF